MKTIVHIRTLQICNKWKPKLEVTPICVKWRDTPTKYCKRLAVFVEEALRGVNYCYGSIAVSAFRSRTGPSPAYRFFPKSRCFFAFPHIIPIRALTKVNSGFGQHTTRLNLNWNNLSTFTRMAERHASLARLQLSTSIVFIYASNSLSLCVQIELLLTLMANLGL